MNIVTHKLIFHLSQHCSAPHIFWFFVCVRTAAICVRKKIYEEKLKWRNCCRDNCAMYVWVRMRVFVYSYVTDTFWNPIESANIHVCSEIRGERTESEKKETEQIPTPITTISIDWITLIVYAQTRCVSFALPQHHTFRSTHRFRPNTNCLLLLFSFVFFIVNFNWSHIQRAVVCIWILRIIAFCLCSIRTHFIFLGVFFFSFRFVINLICLRLRHTLMNWSKHEHNKWHLLIMHAVRVGIIMRTDAGTGYT